MHLFAWLNAQLHIYIIHLYTLVKSFDSRNSINWLVSLRVEQMILRSKQWAILRFIAPLSHYSKENTPELSPSNKAEDIS